MSTALVDNLLCAYRRNFREEHYGSFWKDIFEAHQRPLHEVFMRGTPEEAEEILRNPLSNFLHYGFENTFKGINAAGNHDTSQLRLLSEALGIDRRENPEQPSKRTKMCELWRGIDSPDSILSRIEKTLGRIDFPNPFPGEPGTITKRGIASYRAIHAIYQARLLKGRVLEIGGGLGRTAYYAHRFGVTDYTIVDLPFTGISQGYFLGQALGEHSVKLLSPDEFFASTETYDVALNVDSITELSAKMAQRYAEAVKARAARFISINHEANPFTARELFGRPKSRHPYWMRPGYVEEEFTTA